MSDTKAFASEADLCRAFIEAIGANWTAYPETASWDILLVRNDDGFQVGVEAKLRLNAVVLAQALEDHSYAYRKQGPDCRAVLVPARATVAGIGALIPHLAVTVISMRLPNEHYGQAFNPPLPTVDDRFTSGRSGWYEMCPLERCPLPDYVPDVAAGSSAPIQLTDWKIKAIKIAIILETRGFVTRADFRALKIDPRRWLDGRWLQAGPDGLVAGPAMPAFRVQHPTVYEQIAADAVDWMPKVNTAAQLVLRPTA